MIVGLTGKSCSGKDYVAKLLDKEMFTVIDEDKLGHVALEAEKDKLVEAFGKEILDERGLVNRKVLGPMVFADKSKLEKLNSITHPWMVKETLRIADEIEKSGKIAVINAAILEKMGFVEHCDEILLVYSDYEHRLARAMERDGITEEEFRKRAESQKEIGSTLFSSGKKVITIINNSTEEELSRQISSYCVTMNK